VAAVLADLRLAADLGDRMQMTMAMSDSATVDGVNVFETDQFAIRATERFDINVHDVGTSSEAGPAVALVSAAS
jgi:HK97 family phage major capsid protein